MDPEPSATGQPRFTQAQNVWMVLSFALTGLSWWTYQGPYRWLAELQLRFFGSYGLQITALLTLVIFVLPGLFVFRSVGPQDREAVGSSGTIHPAWMLIVPVGLLGVGLYLHRESRVMRLASVTVEDLEAGTKPASRWVAVKGLPLTDGAMCAKRNVSTECFTPIVTESWSLKTPLVVFISARHEVQASGPYEGLATFAGLPGFLRVAYERRGATVGSGAVVVDLGGGPATVRRDAHIVLGIAGLLSVVFAIAWAHDRHRRRVLAEMLEQTRAMEVRRALEARRRSAAPPPAPIRPE